VAFAGYIFIRQCQGGNQYRYGGGGKECNKTTSGMHKESS